MVRSDILGALKSAISRGHSLESAMQTLINAGYPQNEISQAVSALQTGEQPIEQPQTQQPEEQIQQPQQIQEQPQQVQPIQQPQQFQPAQPKKSIFFGIIGSTRRKVLVIILIILLILLLGFLIVSFIFKEEIIEFLASLF